MVLEVLPGRAGVASVGVATGAPPKVSLAAGASVLIAAGVAVVRAALALLGLFVKSGSRLALGAGVAILTGGA